jgi:hypothetical protein
MRIMPLLQAACLSLMLSACVAPLLLMSPTSQLMWALLKPLVGFDPNEANLFEQPMIKDRMTGILGPNYDSTMQLLKTANELQQEGPLFYVVSRYAPVPDVAKQAGMVWNSQTNQMSVMLLKGDGTPQVFGENLAAGAPSWPSEMQNWQAQGNPTATALSGATNSLTGSATKSLTGAATTSSVFSSVLGSLQQGASKTMADTTKQVVNGATTSAQQQASKAVTEPAKQAASSATATAQQQAAKTVTKPAKQAVSSASTTAQQQASKAVTEPAKQAVSSANATVQQQASKTVTEPAKQAVSSASATATTAADAAAKAEAARAAAEAEMEALLK